MLLLCDPTPQTGATLHKCRWQFMSRSPRVQTLSLCQLLRYISTTGWSAGPLIQQPAVFVWGPDGQKRPRWAPCLCGTEVLPAAAASSSQISVLGGPSPLMPEAYRPPWHTAEKPRGWPASHSPGAVKPHRWSFSEERKKQHLRLMQIKRQKEKEKNVGSCGQHKHAKRDAISWSDDGGPSARLEACWTWPETPGTQSSAIKHYGTRVVSKSLRVPVFGLELVRQGTELPVWQFARKRGNILLKCLFAETVLL